MSKKVKIFNETDTKFLPNKKLQKIAELCLENEKADIKSINIIILNDLEIQKLNNQYLGHDFTTDVISFNLEGENEDEIIGEIYISIDTAKAQAAEYKVSLSNELLRLVAHGTLHICGYDDSTPEEKEAMHLKENELLSNIK